MSPYFLALFIAPPVLALIYAYMEHRGWLDEWFGRSAALRALERLNTAAGHPVSFLYNDVPDQQLFQALEKRISKRTNVVPLRQVLATGCKPSCITVAGNPIILTGIPPQWDVAQQRVYTPSHSVLYVFNVVRGKPTEGGKAERACTLGELETWLAREKETRKYYLGVLLLGIVSITFIVLRYVVTA